MKKLLSIVLALALTVFAAAACAETLTIGATAVPHAEILEFVKDQLAAEGVELEIVVFDDYVQPNQQVEAGDILCNYFQHKPYMDSFNEGNGGHLVAVAGVHYEPMGIYGGKSSDLSAIPDGAVIGIPNDPSNEARALRLLEVLGIITLSEDATDTATVLDVAENPYNVDLQEIAAEQLPRQLEDFDFAVINSNYALEAGKDVVGEALAVEGTDVSYPNIIAVREENVDNELVQKLIKVLQSDETVAWITETYGTAVIPTTAIEPGSAN